MTCLSGTLSSIWQNLIITSRCYNALLCEGNAPDCNCETNDHQYTKELLVDRIIYPCWATFFKTIPNHKVTNDLSWQHNKRVVRRLWKQAFDVLRSR
jgi:hypothetical protein